MTGCSRRRSASSCRRFSSCSSRSALIRWLPAQIRLLSYFSNFILLAAFLGIGIGSLLGRARRSLFVWYPLLQLAVIAAVYFFRLEVRINAPGSIYFTSGTNDPVTAVETTLLLPVLFVGVAALFAALAQRMAQEMTALPPLRAYTINLAGSLAGVAAFALVSWLEARPSAWFVVAFATAVPLLRDRRWTAAAVGARALPGRRGGARRRHGARHDLVAVLQDHGQDPGARDGSGGEQHLAPVDGAGRVEGVLLPVAVHGVRRHLQGRADPGRRVGHRRGRRPRAPRRTASTRSRSTRPSCASGPGATRIARTPTRACAWWPTTPGTSCGRPSGSTTSWCSR